MMRKACVFALNASFLLASGASFGADYEARAVINALDRAILSGEIAAKVDRLPLRPGDAFVKGDLLVALDCALYEAQTAKVSAEVKGARIKRNNAQDLNALHSIGALDVALAQSEYSQSLAELRIAKLNTERCEIHAPWEGRVVSLLVNAHENIRQQQALIEIVGDRQLEAEVVVPAAWISWLTVGMPLQLQVDDVAAEVEASVATIIPAIDTVSQTVLVRVALPVDSNLIPGMSAIARFDVPQAQ
ncbi:efflux RND transporter periplasmic adaptor subunit [Neptunomonas antarctica]|uniref:RND family efflux transporter, MFP subunit n=1 Tax=Neptunomonas antarctica TaxID=619304 RepID=A0A1N7J9T7_9GAMM|nr:HlyD family efflux transporter periplasmic adaptor subunit [Neptunomonas antarctica]SIS46021.1 RND family efflux transporter, MFP subunit [Neptunomonas antarctica]